MDKETYEALKGLIEWIKPRVVVMAESPKEHTETMSTIYCIENWIDEVAKDYVDEVKECEHKNTENGSACICSDCGEVQYFEADEN